MSTGRQAPRTWHENPTQLRQKDLMGLRRQAIELTDYNKRIFLMSRRAEGYWGKHYLRLFDLNQQFEFNRRVQRQFCRPERHPGMSATFTEDLHQ